MIHNLKGRRIFYILAAVLCVALLAGAILAVNVMAAPDDRPDQGGQGSSGYSQHIDVRLVTDDFEFTQTITESSTQKITVNKTWDDDDADHSDDAVTVYLIDSDGNKITDSEGNYYTATLNEEGGWTSSWSGLTLNAGDYSAVEDAVTGYTSSATSVTVAKAGSSTMTVTVKGSLELTGINSTLTYTHNGTTYTTTGYTVQTDTEDGKTVYEYHFKEEATSGSTTSGPSSGSTIALSDGDTITVVVTFKATYTVEDSEGKVIDSATDKVFTDYGYTETVASANNYCSGGGYDFYIYPEELLEAIISEESKTITITNTPSTIDIPVNKTWSGDDDYTDIRPSSVTVSVCKGEEVVKTLTLSEDNNWSGTFEDLPEYDTTNGATNATKITYNVVETDVDGYETAYSTADNGTVTITNTLKTATVDLTKTVSGNMGDTTKKFSFTVSYTYTDANGTGKTKTSEYSLSDEESLSTIGEYGVITVPYGATVTITEDNNSGYTVTATVNSDNADVQDSSLSFTVTENSYEVVVDNYKSIPVDTGVVLESIPYIAILAVVVVGGVVLLRRRSKDED